MLRFLPNRFWLMALLGCILIIWILLPVARSITSVPRLLTDPFLQLPTPNSVNVVWFTEFAGTRHTVSYGKKLEQTAIAQTTQLTHTREDANSRVGGQVADGKIYPQTQRRSIWRHEAMITGLSPNRRVPYRVTSLTKGSKAIASNTFSLTASPAKGTPLKILLTSDHQLMPMVTANLQKVAETVGRVDAVFMSGDLVNIPDRASEWFDDNRGGAFFPALQGRGSYTLEKSGTKTRYTGGALIQHAPLFPAIGNHEVMGQFSRDRPLNEQFADPIPRAIAAKLATKPAALTTSQLKDASFNTDTYEEIFSLPQTSPGGKQYYAVSFGDIRLIVLYATNIWRTPSLEADARGKYRERQADLNQPAQWGYGQHIFAPIAKGSKQYDWLTQELKSPAFQQAKYKIVMFHHPPHSLGENVVPAYTNPVQSILKNNTGQITAIQYEYPIRNDYLIRDVVPLLTAAKVQLVFYGHSHLWNRFISPEGMHFLESSNVGNSYGAYVGEKRRNVPKGYRETYAVTDDPNGLMPVTPAIAPLMDKQGNPQPYLSSNDITAFSIFDTETGTVSSYRFDTRTPQVAPVKFDEFTLGLE
jgi:Calcineurin-like phosphoesterase